MGTFLLLWIAAAAFGAVVGALAWAFFRHGGRSLGPLTLLLVGLGAAAVFFGVARGRVAGRGAHHDLEAMALALYGNPASAARYADVIGPLADDARLRARLAGARGAAGERAVFEAITHEGLARIDDLDRERLFDVKRALAAKSAEVCAGFWTGRVGPDVMQGALRTLDEAQQRTWIDVSGRALAFGLEGAPAPHVDPAERNAALTAVVSALDGAPRGNLVRGLETETAALSRDDACAAFQSLAAGVTRVAPGARQVILRAITNPELVGS